MTNLQLLLAIGLPIFMILIAMLTNNVRMDRMEKRFNERLDGSTGRIDKRIDEVVQSVAEIRKNLSEVTASITKNTDEIKSAGHRDALEIMRNMTALHERVAIVEARQNS